MADHIVTRATRKLVTRAPAHVQLPDPFHGLPAITRAQLLTIGPTWSERWRLCDPKLSKEQKRDLLIDILFERRREYDHQLAQRRHLVYRQAVDTAYQTGKAMPLPPQLLYSTSLKQMNRQRRLQDERENQIREAYFQRRREQEQRVAEMDDDDEPPRKRGRGR